MALIETSNPSTGMYEIVLSPLGAEIQKEDPALHEYLTQLLVHLMLARPIGGALVWHVLFGESAVSLGRQFSVESGGAFISSRLAKSSSIPGPLFSTYREESSLARSAMLSFDKNMVKRTHIPSNPDYYWGIAYCWLNYWEHSAPQDQQLALSTLETITGFRDIAGWTIAQYDEFLAWAADHSIARVDRQTGEPLIMRIASSQDLVGRIYSELI